MEKLNVILCSAAVCCVWIFGFAASQTSTRCLFSRLDVLPCILNAETAQPVTNEQAIYRTRIGRSRSGSLQCTYRNPIQFPDSEILQPINDLGNPNLRLIFSPGFLREEDYANAMLVTYNVQCPVGRLAFFNLNQLNLQGPDCFDRCTDYIEVNRGDFGRTESCGTEPQDNLFQLEEGSFNVTFRTSERERERGFEIYVICFDPLELDLPGCVRIGENTTMNSTGSNTSNRRKRDLEEFHNQWRRRLRRGAAGTRFQQLNIAHGETITFRDSLLTVANSTVEVARFKTLLSFCPRYLSSSSEGENRCLNASDCSPVCGMLSSGFRNVLVLHTFDNESNLDQFVREAAVMNQTTGGKNFIQFIGPGPMTIIGRHVYLQLFAIDPRGIIPNAEEMAVLEELTNELFETLPPENDTVLPDPEPPTEELLEPPILGGRRKRQEPDATNFISDEAIREAILNENACNPALLTLSQITLQVATEQNATRVEIIRRMIEGTLPALNLVCSLAESANTINVNCSVENVPVSSGMCSFDSLEPFPCSLPLFVFTTNFTAGDHNITVTVTQDGLTGQDTLGFVVNRLSCSSVPVETSGGLSGDAVTCTLNNNNLEAAQCSLSDRPFEPCTFPFVMDFGNMDLTVRVTLPDGQVLEVTLPFLGE